MDTRRRSSTAVSICLGLSLLTASVGYAGEVEPECTRGAPEQLVKGSHFQMFGTHEASELVALDETTQIVIRHYGCEHYAQKFTFLVANAAQPATDIVHWRERGAQLLSTLGQASHDAGQLTAMAEAIGGADRSTQADRYGEPISQSEMETLTLHAVDLPDGVVALTVLYVVAL